ncbi:uncharacterized protein B0T15DRAFT_557099 [Chaetomium strumarium]|uniref:Uncharacterized protein n=1 Tax=Chaetomium strumarium TaxID=1170767 RepID=A0AAJ0GU77_9PEZI|nr:hypothetical protein B0T15DRAFT_557099 [Chaetomium strumarium]
MAALFLIVLVLLGMPVLVVLYRMFRDKLWEESEYQIKLHKKYGPIVRYGPNTVIVNLPHELPTVYHRRADKSDWYSYSMTAIKPFEENIDERIKEWQTELESRFCAADGTQALKFHEAINFLAYNIVTEIAFGEPLGFVRKWSDHHGLINSYEGSISRALGRLPFPEDAAVREALSRN